MRERKSFGRILETLEAGGEQPDGAFANPLSTAAAPIPPEAIEDPGVENLWDHAFAWAIEPKPDSAPERSQAGLETPSDDPATIAAELGLENLTRRELHRARRLFMWRNHPDRSPDVPAALANRRAAIANRLVDFALKTASKDGAAG